MDTTSNKLIRKNLHTLLESLPSLKHVLDSLKAGGVKYGIFAGACVSIITSNREPTDIDILVADEDFGKLKTLFKGTVKTINEGNSHGKFYFIDENSKLEFVSKLNFVIKGKTHPIRLTPLAWKNILRYDVDGTGVILLNPVDTLLEKAISPRGAEVGKHDSEDIAALMKDAPIDVEYLQKRVIEMKAKEEVAGVFRKYKIYNNSVYKEMVFGRSQ